MKYLSLALLPIALVACGGGSSSSSTATTSSTPSTPVTIESFTSWSATTANVPVAMTGGFSSSVDLVGKISQSVSSGAGTFTRDASNSFTLISASASTDVTAVFSAALGDTLKSTFDGATTTTLDKAQATIGNFNNPSYYGFQYQTYGAWGPFGKATGASFALSDGSASPVSAIPSVGGLTFTGGSVGYFVDTNKFAYVTNASMVAVLSNDKQIMTFTTSNTGILGGPSGNALPFSDLDFTTDLYYVAGTNYYIGTIQTDNSNTSKINGQFYGPGINEFGGTYAIYDSGGTEIMAGSFGGKR